MTDMAEALVDKSHLQPFENKPVVKAAIEIPGAAGGLQEAMKFDPVELHQGEEVHVVLRCTVAKVRFEPIDKEEPSGAQSRVQILRAEEATLVDGDVVEEHLTIQRLRIQKAKDDAAGIQGLPFHGDGGDEESDDDE